MMAAGTLGLYYIYCCYYSLVLLLSHDLLHSLNLELNSWELKDHVVGWRTQGTSTSFKQQIISSQPQSLITISPPLTCCGSSCSSWSCSCWKCITIMYYSFLPTCTAVTITTTCYFFSTPQQEWLTRRTHPSLSIIHHSLTNSYQSNPHQNIISFHNVLSSCSSYLHQLQNITCWPALARRTQGPGE